MARLLERLKDLTLPPMARKVRARGLTYLSRSKLRSLIGIINRINQEDIAGDVYEFGIAKGGSAILMAELMGNRRFRGYDVFGLIPPPGEKDEQDTHDRYQVIVSGRARGIRGDKYYGYEDNLMDQVIASFAEFGRLVDGDRITLHRGLFQDTLRLAPDDRIALAHIDCDWYDPVLFCLETIADNISPGGFIVVDDFNDYEGCRKATTEFLAGRQDFSIMTTRSHAVLRKSG